MSTPDPRTEVAMECADRIAEAFIRNGTTRGECRQIARDALTTEAARVRAETWREAAKQVAFYNCDHNHGVAATKACDDLEDQFLRQASNPTATTQPTWSTPDPRTERAQLDKTWWQRLFGWN